MREMSFNTQGSTTYLVLKLEPADELDRLAVGMITNNKIPGLLSVSPRRVNRDSYLYYSISSLTPLTSAYGALSNDKRLLLFLRSLCRLAMECHEYLLDEEGLILSPEHVYIQMSTCEIQVPYLPVMQGRSDVTPYQFVRSLVLKVSSSFSPDSKLLPVLYRMVLTEEQFSLTLLDEQLAQLQIGGAVQTDKASAADAVRPQNAEISGPPYREQFHTQDPAVVRQEPEATEIAQEIPVQTEEAKDEKDSLLKKFFSSGKTPAEKPPKPQKPAKPSKEKPAKSGGKGFNFAIPGISNAVEEETAEPSVAEVYQQTPAPVAQKKDQFYSAQQKNPSPVSTAPEMPKQEPPRSQQPQGGGYTYNLDGMDSGAPLATSPMMDLGNAGGPAPLWLVRRSTGQQVQITHSNFHIGRGQDLVDFFISTSMPYLGIDHAYILIQGSEYFFVDNNSKNHSWLNGNMLEGSRPYPIQAGDYLRLADEYFDVVSC